MPETPRRFLRRTWVRRTLPAGIAAVVIVAGTAVPRANANAGPVDTYRTGTVTTGSVEQRLNLPGAVHQVDQVSQSFAVAGTVSSVRVAVGDTVATGQVLAGINPLPLHRAVTAAQASLAKASATLESDQSSTTTAANNSSGTAAAAATPSQSTTPTISPRVASPSGRSGSSAGQGLTQAKKRVTSAQRALLADLGAESAALRLCAPFFPSATAQPGSRPTGSPTTPPATTPTTPTTNPSTTGVPTPTSTTAGPAAPSGATTAACLAALRGVPTQKQAQRDQQALMGSQTDLMTAVTLALTTTGATNTSAASIPAAGQQSTSRSSGTSSASTQSASTRSASTQSATTQSLTSRSTGSLSPGGQTSTSGQSSPARIVSDQAAVTSAKASLSTAQADLTSATLKSSISGTVGSVTLVSGTSSAGESVVIVGAGAVEVTVSVPLASIGSVHLGQSAKVTPQGATSSAPGSVTSVSLLPSTSSSGGSSGKTTTQTTTQTTGTGSATTSSPVYPVVILIPDALPALASGSRADVSLLIGTAAMVLTVPNSALTPLGAGQAMAVTYKNGVATRTLVKTGYTGTLITQVTSGLAAGQRVVLADLSTALPTNTTNSRRFGVGGASGTGGLGGAGFGGTGLGGAGGGGAGGFPPRG